MLPIEERVSKRTRTEHPRALPVADIAMAMAEMAGVDATSVTMEGEHSDVTVLEIKGEPEMVHVFKATAGGMIFNLAEALGVALK